jgi:hypothetical protein
MQKLSRNSIVMLYNSCRVSHKEYKKLSLNFSVFSTIFYGFSKFQLKSKHYLRSTFAGRSLELSWPLQICRCLTVRALERLQSKQLGPPGRGGAARRNLARPAAGSAGEGAEKD